MNEFDASKLPKYAQERIAVLERDLNKLQARFDALSTNQRSDLYYKEMLEEPRYLPPRATVVFVMGEGPYPHIRVSFRTEGSEKFIDVNGDGTLAITPNASNSIRITHRKD